MLTFSTDRQLFSFNLYQSSPVHSESYSALQLIKPNVIWLHSCCSVILTLRRLTGNEHFSKDHVRTADILNYNCQLSDLRTGKLSEHNYATEKVLSFFLVNV